MFETFLDALFGYRRPNYPLKLGPASVAEPQTPSIISFFLPHGAELKVKEKDDLIPGHLLGEWGDGCRAHCPFKGQVTSILSTPDLRGGKSGVSVLIAPEFNGPPEAFHPLDPDKATVADLKERLDLANLKTNALNPKPLMEEMGENVDTLIILAADAEPEVSCISRLLKDRGQDMDRAGKMLGRIFGAARVLYGIPAPLAQEFSGLELCPILAQYPHSLGPMVIRQADMEGITKTLSLETALAALDAVEKGLYQLNKMVTLIGPNHKALANYSVPLGTRISDLLEWARIEVNENDKVVAGGPMRGFPQYALTGAIDEGVDAITVVPAGDMPDFTDQPCINCGGCIDACPLNLQAQLIGRYAEFNLFDSAEEIGIEHCIECGLCANSCTARRPLLQLILLAKQEIANNKLDLEQEQESVPEDA